MMFFRRHAQKPIPQQNSIVTSPISINLEKIKITEDEHESTENELSTTPTALSPIAKTVTFSNEIDSTITTNTITTTTTSTTEHLSLKHPGLLRLFDSTVCTVSIVITYLFSTKEPMVQEFLGRKLFEYPDEELDFYLPQLINMYIHIPSISSVIHTYLTARCCQSVDFSLQCAWLLDAYIAEQMKVAKKPNAAVRFLFDILYEKYKPKICYKPTTINNIGNNHHRLDEEENENATNQDDDTKSERALSQDNLTASMNRKRGHQKSRSDVSGIILSRYKRSLPMMNGEPSKHRRQPRLCLGDLSSGRAFDNNCWCFESVNGFRRRECTCNAPKLAPVREFMTALINIGKKLPHVPTKDKKTQNLISEMKRMNMNLPARVWIPFYRFSHHVVRIAYTESTVLNSRDRAPYIVYIEIVLCDNVFASPLPIKQNDSKLRSTRSEENLTEHINNHQPPSVSGVIGSYLNCETQSLDSELIDPYRSFTNSEDADIWSTSDEVTADDQQQLQTQSASRRNGLIGYRSNHTLNINPETQSIRSTESHLSQQEIMPFDIRKRLTEVQTTGPILFDRDPDDPSAATLKEPWDKKEQRIRQASPYGHLRNWRLVAAIVKCGDDLRHELLAYQFMVRLKEIWFIEHVPVFVRPINILVLSNNSGLIEPILNAVSLHQIKKNSKLSLRNYFLREFGTERSEEYLTAVKNFVQSCAAYSIICYLLQVKDRHNGNILLDDEGHLIHIDFGYMLSATPKNLGFESSPFKITQEFVDIMGGLQSDMYGYYKILILRALIAARKHMDKLMSIVEIMQHGSQLNCFSKGNVTLGLRERFHLNMTDEQLEFNVEKMVESSLNSLTTRVYDTFQYYTNGLTPGLSRASELQQRMTKVIKTIKLNLKDNSNEAAYFGFLQFTYSNNANRNVDDNEENDRLSSFVHLAASTRPWSLAKLIEAYQLRAPDFILSIQTGNVYDNDPHKQKSGIQTETERAIQHGLTDTARMTRE
ncbi:unnamed protein product [Rotaria magnacalcarata]|uniref:Phosphatidylinositol 4-kinase beta n=3 Tax=Rotaria magnacalcarata TaxID=392030 RepID=A0A816W546_9BILA|nr:unnamed protein product [Rotaria magnacalcarata]